jgi:hypothetical protein
LLATDPFEACRLYLRDFMKALDGDDVSTIQSLREHRNDLAYNLAEKLSIVDVGKSKSLWDQVDRTIFKLSNCRAYMEIGSDPEFRGIDWSSAKGGEVVGSMLLNEQINASMRSRGSPIVGRLKAERFRCRTHPSS